MVQIDSHHFYPQARIEYWSVQKTMLEAEAQRNMLFIFKKFGDKIMAYTNILRGSLSGEESLSTDDLAACHWEAGNYFSLRETNNSLTWE